MTCLGPSALGLQVQTLMGPGCPGEQSAGPLDLLLLALGSWLFPAPPWGHRSVWTRALGREDQTVARSSFEKLETLFQLGKINF